ncbi:MAG TPA: GNAT family N-acetyltransferase [Tepidisphaeraceae bacterium]
MSTTVVHFLTFVGRPGDDAAAGVDRLVAARQRLALEPDPEEDFAPDRDPLWDWTYRDEVTINAFCHDLLRLAHSLPVLFSSQFVRNGTTGCDPMLRLLLPPGDAPRAMSGLNFAMACYGSDRASETLAAIEAKLAEPEQWVDVPTFLEHLRAALRAAHWLEHFTVVVLEQDFDGTREDFEIEAAMNAPLGIPMPSPFWVRPAEPPDRDALLGLWHRSASADYPYLTEDDIRDLTTEGRNFNRPQLLGTVLIAPDGTPAGLSARREKQLKGLFVDPTYRRQGGGRQLVEYTAFSGRDLEAVVDARDADACRFCAALGFTVADRIPADDRDTPFPLLKLHRGRKACYRRTPGASFSV